jgi:hypothetical protein
MGRGEAAMETPVELDLIIDTMGYSKINNDKMAVFSKMENVLTCFCELFSNQ